MFSITRGFSEADPRSQTISRTRWVRWLKSQERVQMHQKRLQSSYLLCKRLPYVSFEYHCELRYACRKSAEHRIFQVAAMKSMAVYYLLHFTKTPKKTWNFFSEGHSSHHQRYECWLSVYKELLSKLRIGRDIQIDNLLYYMKLF